MRFKFALAIMLIGMIAIAVFLVNKESLKAPNQSNEASHASANSEEQQNQNSSEPQFDKTQYSLTETSSPWVIVNKLNSIPTDYAPELVIPDVKLRLASSNEQMKISASIQQDLEDMFAAAKEEGVSLVFGSGYRSSALQNQFYSSYVAQDGQELADTYSARPGHSEHQTGLALDVTSPGGNCHLEICWENTTEGKWIAANSYKFGFIIRYPENKSFITGYQYEPWHIRHFGLEAATEIQNSGLTVEEFFNLPEASDYAD